MIGTTLDKYEVLQKVGEGGMATVYRGRHATLHRDVAIKVLHPHLSSSSRNRKRFAREARAIEHLRHDNILEIFDYSGVEAEECYIITEFVEGETLSSVLRRRGRFPSEVTAIVGLRLAHALGYAHREGILHRDLKPDNVMLREDGAIKLMDFGIARFLDESQVTMTGALVGSPAFMSPEQARELPLDQRSDLFSLGTMLFYLVTGHLPFSGSNPSVILKNVIEANRPSVSELTPTMSATLADVIERLMATSPDDRFNTAEDVASALDNALAEANVDPDDARWGLAAWLEEPDAYEQRLDAHLRQVLLLRGRQHLDAGDHLAALRLFNRLLSVDEDNPEVLELVQNLHGEARRRPSAGILGVVGIAAVVILGGAYLAYAGWGVPAEGALLDGAADTVEPPPDGPPPDRDAANPTEATDVDAPEQLAEAPLPTPRADDDGPLSPPPPPAPQDRASATARATPPSSRARLTRPTRVSPPPEAEPRAEEPMARLVIRSREIPGDIYLDNRKMGATRDHEPILVPAGSYDVEIRSQFVEPVTLRIEVEPGETFETLVELKALPASVEFRVQDYADTCVVSVDGRAVGDLGAVERVLTIDQPGQAHHIEVDCDGVVTTKHYPHVPRRAIFPAP